MVFVPYLGALLLPTWRRFMRQTRHRGWRACPYATPFYQRVRRLVEWCVTRRKTVIALTALVFIGSVVLFKFVRSSFPASSRLELMVDMKLAEGASLSNTDQVKQLEALLKDHPGIENYVAYEAPVRPAITCHWISNCPRRALPSLCWAADHRGPGKPAHLVDRHAQ